MTVEIMGSVEITSVGGQVYEHRNLLGATMQHSFEPSRAWCHTNYLILSTLWACTLNRHQGWARQ